MFNLKYLSMYPIANRVKNKVNRNTEAHLFPTSNHHKLLPYQSVGGKIVKNVQIDPQTTEIWSKVLFVTLSVRV